MNGFDAWINYCGVAFRRHPTGPYHYTTAHMALDADGSPFAYHPDNTGRDDLRFASWPTGPEDWRLILVPDPADPSQPFVQPDGPTAGYFLSMTTLRDPSGAPTDAGTYVDSDAVPYLVFPANFLAIEGVGGFGDVAMVRNRSNGRQSFAVVADQGPAPHPLGEVSLRLAENLGGVKVNPRNGDGIPPGPYQVMVFPGSRLAPPWPQTADALAKRAETLFAAIGGWPDA